MPKPDRRARALALRLLAPALAAALAGAPAEAQLLGRPLGGLGGALSPPLATPLDETVGREAREAASLPRLAAPAEAAVDQALSLARDGLGEVSRIAGARLLREHPEAVEADAEGRPVLRGVVLALAPSPDALARARAAGFKVRTDTAGDALGLSAARLEAPHGVSAREALARLRALDPDGQYDLDPIYLPSGRAADPPERGAGAPAARDAAGLRLGLVDGSVAAGQRVFRRARVVQKAFGPGGARVSAHATAVGSLMVGADGPFRGAVPGAALYVADIYGPTPAGGSADALVRGLAWLAQNRTPVIDVSLVGPPNLLLGAAVRSLVARGYLVVAAVGNDGPAAPPLYPASYPGVVAVTAVDAQRRLLPEAGRASHVDFAAPGAQMAVAAPDGGFVTARGTSFAAPLAAGELARELTAPDPAAAQHALAIVAHRAVDLGAPGHDPVFGWGLVGEALRTDPAKAGARAARIAGP